MANNAARVVTDHVDAAVDPGLLARGGGRVDAVEAFDAASWFDPVSVSFGLARANRPFSQTRTVLVGGLPAAAAEAVFVAAPPAGLTLTATPSADGASVSSTMTIDRTVPAGDYSGDLRITAADGQQYLVPFWVRVTTR